MLKIIRSCDRLIFNLGISIPGQTLYILRQGPDCDCDDVSSVVFHLCEVGFLSGAMCVIVFILSCVRDDGGGGEIFHGIHKRYFLMGNLHFANSFSN